MVVLLFCCIAFGTPCVAGLPNDYYKNLKFQILENIGTVKPAYDFKCIFMSQEVNDLEQNMNQFFQNINPDPSDDIV